jgi:hypothetical protein
MLRFRAAIAMLLIFLASYFGPQLAFASSRAHAQEKTIPQGEDPPGTDEEQTAPPTEHKGVIPVPSENLIRWIRSRKENRIMIETDGDLLRTFARIYAGLLSFA